LTPELLKSFAKFQFNGIYPKDRYTYSQRIRADILEVFNVAISSESLCPYFNKWKRALNPAINAEHDATAPAVEITQDTHLSDASALQQSVAGVDSNTSNVLEALLECFPFALINFHADNGSEYINKRVAALLKKRLIEFTKSRPRKTNDTPLAESKNGSVVRKLFGSVPIPQRGAPLINEFNQQHLHPYLNTHRPCCFPKVIIDNKGKQRNTYPYTGMMTPYDKLKSLANGKQYLKPGITFKQLDAIAYEISR